MRLRLLPLMSTFAALLQELRCAHGATTPSGFAETGVPGVGFFWNDHPVPRAPLLYESGLVLVAQGKRVGYLGGRRIEYGAGTALVIGVPVPFECEVQASPDEPLLGLRLDVAPALLHGLIAQTEGRVCDPESAGAHFGVEPVSIEGELLEATKRLVRSLADPLDRAVVAPAAVREIVFRILRGDQGRVLAALTRHQSAYASISRALTRIHRDYHETLNVAELASESAMSVSAFHRAFKQVTGESPLQYLKKLRLLKAKARLVFEGMRVEEAANSVGYVSPSQFSREFKRYFAVPPSEASSLPYSDALQILV